MAKASNMLITKTVVLLQISRGDWPVIDLYILGIVLGKFAQNREHDTIRVIKLHKQNDIFCCHCCQCFCQFSLTIGYF